MKPKIKIESVRIEYKIDENPDTSWLGEFTDTPSEWAIVRQGEHAGQFVNDLPEDAELPDRGREYRFFLPGNHLPHNPKNWAHVQGKELDAVIAKYGSILEADKAYAVEDWRRIEALNNGDWCFIGIIAKAEIAIPNANGQYSTIQTIRSGGLWGIESDSSREYLAETAKERLADIRGQLIALGLGERAIAHAFKTVDLLPS